MQLSKEDYARKRTNNGYLVQIKKSRHSGYLFGIIRQPPDAEQLPSRQNFQSAAHSH